MADPPFYPEGTLTDDESYVVRGGQWVPNKSTDTQASGASEPLEIAAPKNKILGEMEGLTKAGGTGLIKGATDVAGLPGDVQELATAGLNRVMPTPAQGGQQQPTPPGWYGDIIDALKSGSGALELPTSASLQKKVEGFTGPFYQPQTPGEKVAGAAGEAVPFGMLGGGAMLPNMGRAALSGAASEAAGQATQGTPFETPARMLAGLGTYGGTGALYRPSINPTNLAQAAAQRLESQGVRIPASAISGNRLTATLEGGPLSIKAPVSNAMQEVGGVPIPPGNTEQYRVLLDQHYQNNLKPELDRLGAQTSIPASVVPQTRQGLAQVVQKHMIEKGGINPGNDDAVNNALKTYDQQVMGGQGLSGTNYDEMHREWSQSPVPAVRSMSKVLDQSMDNAHPGVWPAARRAYADYSGLKSESDRLGGAAGVTPFSPDEINKSMYAHTPMRQIAEDAQTVGAAQPQPYDFGNLNQLGALIGGLTGGIGAGAGYLHGGVPLAEAGGLLGLVPGLVTAGAGAIPKLASPVFRTAGGQNFLRNMDPKMVAALLAQQGISRKGTPGEQPSQ
jgi:hypothetical protein